MIRAGWVDEVRNLIAGCTRRRETVSVHRLFRIAATCGRRMPENGAVTQIQQATRQFAKSAKSRGSEENQE